MTDEKNQSFKSLKMAAELKTEGVKKETIFQVEPGKVKIRPGFNRPISRDNVEQFKVAIRNGATIPPIYVKVERTRNASTIYMVDGEHRHIAVTELIAEGMHIPFMSAIEFKGSDADAIAHLLTSAQGLAISPLDQGIQYLRLERLKWTRDQISERTGRSKTHIDNCITLASSPTDVQESVRSGSLSGTLAVGLLREHGDDAGNVIVEELEKVKKLGKTKVTKKTITGGSTPRKLLTRVTDSVGQLLSTIPEDTRKCIEAGAEDIDVRIPAASLKKLLEAHAEIEKQRAQAASDSSPGDSAGEGQSDPASAA